MRQKAKWTIPLVLAVAAAAVAFFLVKPEGPKVGPEATAPAAGQPRQAVSRVADAPSPGRVTMIDLGVDSCVPCKMMAPIIEELKREYAGAFSLGLFLTIAVVGIVCAYLGRMLGVVGDGWQVLVGAVLVWVALGMLGVHACSMSGSLLYRLNLRGIHGAFGLGLAYGVLSGSCTFGFIAPILAIVTVQQKIFAGALMMILFALGHCMPIAVAGSSTAMVRRITENSAWQGAGLWFQRGSGAVVGLLGIYFITNPFVRM
jgi:cytochrome c-type biogenesis protein